MKTHEQNLISELLDAAKAAGADGADATLARGEGNSVDIRLGKVEAALHLLEVRLEEPAALGERRLEQRLAVQEEEVDKLTTRA